MARKPKGEGAARLEFVWEADYLDPGRPVSERVALHAVPRGQKTAGRVYVEVQRFDEDRWQRRCEAGGGSRRGSTTTSLRSSSIAGSWSVVEGVRSRTHRSGWGGEFYPSKEAAQAATGRASRPGWARRPGPGLAVRPEGRQGRLPAGRELRIPDAGGDAAEFVRIEAAYRQAMSITDP